MKYLIVDCETSGLFDFSKPADADGQPRLASLTMIRASEDLTELDVTEFLVKPDGWELGEEAAAVNGLSMAKLDADGLPVAEVLAAYAGAIDDGLIVVAFNAQYDTKVMRGEMRRAGIDDRFERTPNICVMRALVDVCQIPKKKGGGFKLPKLAEACAHFGIVNGGEHTSGGDAMAALELFRNLHELGRVPEAAVHYAKTMPDRAPEAA